MRVKYTYTFERDDESRFRDCLSRLDPEEYTLIRDVYIVDEANARYSQREAIVEMEPDACLTIRLGMKQIKIRRERTEEELEMEKELNERNTVRITVQVPMGPQTP